MLDAQVTSARRRIRTGSLDGAGGCRPRSRRGGLLGGGTGHPGCATQGESFEELLTDLYEAVKGCLSVDVSGASIPDRGRVIEIAV